MKMNPTQRTLMVDFLEEHPFLLTHRFRRTNRKRGYNKLWAELANKLNAIGSGNNTVEEWQKSLMDWEEELKYKAADTIESGYQGVNGGENQAPPLNENESRLMNIIGWISVTGDGGREMGVPISTSNSALMSPKFVKIPKNLVLTPMTQVAIVNSSQVPPLFDIQKPGPSRETGAISSTSRNPTLGQKRKATEDDEVKPMHNGIINALNNISNSLDRLTNNVEKLVDIFGKRYK